MWVASAVEDVHASAWDGEAVLASEAIMLSLVNTTLENMFGACGSGSWLHGLYIAAVPAPRGSSMTGFQSGFGFTPEYTMQGEPSPYERDSVSAFAFERGPDMTQSMLGPLALG